MWKHRLLLTLAVASTAVFGASRSAHAADHIVISEIFYDAPGDMDYQKSYIELRGTPNMSLDSYYLLFTENENTHSSSNPSGNLDNVFDLTGMKIGTNGFLILLPQNFDRGLDIIAPGTAVYQNEGTLPNGQPSTGFGSGASSTIGQTNQNGTGDIENGSFTALLIKRGTGPLPTANMHLDPNKTGELDPTVIAGWTIVDSVGESEPSENDAYTYGAKTFFSEELLQNKAAGTDNVFTDLEVEYIFRWGSQENGNPSDWAIANITDNPFSFDPDNYGEDGYVVSGDHIPENPQPGQIVRGSKTDDVAPGYQSGQRNLAPEGTVIQNTLGRPNYPIPEGDLNEDGVVDVKDLNIVLGNFGAINMNLLGDWAFGDISGDGVVGIDDLNIVLAHFGEGTLIIK